MLEPDKKKLARATAAALSALQEAGPRGVTTLEGIAIAGTRFSARTHELEKMGWIIEVKKIPGKLEFRYKLLGHKANGQLLLFEAA